MRPISLAASLLLAAATLAGCASTGATFRSGVGDTFLEHAPWYAGRRTAGAAASPGRLVHIPVAYQRGGAQPAFLDPSGAAATPVAGLLAEMTAYLDSLGVSRRVTLGAAAATPPDVHFGCDLGSGEDCPERGDSTLGRKLTTMRLAVGRPSRAWTGAARAAIDGAGAAEVLVVTLEVGQYWTRQRGLAGRKELELGTGHTAHLPWLTSLEAPVSVLQLTGALVDRDGRAVRIGAEGILARRSSIVESGLGLQRLITDEDVKAARTLRRDDLPGRPLAWQVALRNLVAGLTGVADVAAR